MRKGVAVVSVIGLGFLFACAQPGRWDREREGTDLRNDGGGGKLGPKKRRQPSALAGSCTNKRCHPGVGKQGKVVHGPVAAGKCATCHKHPPGRHAFADPKKIDCLGCHEGYQGTTVHEPVEQGKCLACHDAHASDHAKLVRKPEAELCQGCHETPGPLKKEWVHGPAATSCSVCHPPHASKAEGLLVEEGATLCLDCHSDILPADTKDLHVHAPVDECTNCHDPHQSDHGLGLSAKVPELCLDCHDEVAESIQTAKVKHGALEGKDSCLACHRPHVAKYERLLDAQPMDLCLSCHGAKPVKDRQNRKLADIKALLAKNPRHHGPIRQKSCQECHRSHASQNFRLLTKPYPRTFYAPFKVESFGLCFSCHPKEAILTPRTTRHTGFRNGDRNLHSVHVRRKVKGRTCRSCHETHASPQPKHIRDSVPFGRRGWKLPIRFQKTPTGGSCAPGCHKPYGYDRDRPVQNRKKR